MKPNRNFRFKNKKECFVLVGFRYDQMESLEYIQRVKKEYIVQAVERLLSYYGADVISIRRVYLDQEIPVPDEVVTRQGIAPLTKLEILDREIEKR